VPGGPINWPVQSGDKSPHSITNRELPKRSDGFILVGKWYYMLLLPAGSFVNVHSHQRQALREQAHIYKCNQRHIIYYHSTWPRLDKRQSTTPCVTAYS
jgi:hypothetical protein